MNPPTPAPPSIDRVKRAMLLVIIALGLLSTITAWAVRGMQGSLTPTLNWVQGITTITLAILLIADWRRLLPQRAIELGCLMFAAGIFAACMALSMYWPRLGAGIRLPPLYLWIPVMYVLAFTLTNHKTGLLIAAGIFVLLAGISLPYLMQGSAARDGNLTLQLHFVSAMLIAALYYFSSYQYRLGSVQQAVDKLAQLSNTDELTGLSNRRHMAAVITDALASRAGRNGGFAVMLFDIDHFKAINDQLGHGAGDKVLAVLAKRAAHAFRDADDLGRWGGDEFLAVVRGVDAEEAERMAEALRLGIAAEPLLNRCHATISCGVTLAHAGDNIDNLLQRADVALYTAKRAGRNRVEGIILKPSRSDTQG